MFTKTAKLLAILMCLLGVWLVFAGVAFGDSPSAMKRYLGSQHPGHYIDRGIYMFVFGVVLGVLAEINHSIKSCVKSGDAE